MTIEDMVNQELRIHLTALKILLPYFSRSRYSEQIDRTIDDIKTDAKMLLLESRRQYMELRMSANVKA